MHISVRGCGEAEEVVSMTTRDDKSQCMCVVVSKQKGVPQSTEIRCFSTIIRLKVHITKKNNAENEKSRAEFLFLILSAMF